MDDLDGAEKIADEWESQYIDAGVPRLMICDYCKMRHLEKTQAYVNRLMENGKVLDPYIWSNLETCQKVIKWRRQWKL